MHSFSKHAVLRMCHATCRNCLLSVSRHMTVHGATMETAFMLWACSVMVLAAWVDAHFFCVVIRRFGNSVMRPRTLQQIWMYSQGPQIDPDVVSWCLQQSVVCSHSGVSSWWIFMMPLPVAQQHLSQTEPAELAGGRTGPSPGSSLPVEHNACCYRQDVTSSSRSSEKEGAEMGWNSLSVSDVWVSGPGSQIYLPQLHCDVNRDYYAKQTERSCIYILFSYKNGVMMSPLQLIKCLSAS